ncbi:unnamed protein product [Peronospora farinosa]|uniref:Uncharacterized protein n=1 Tax=Peronospora farinosa TaxID=134698 RepID=A0AAV0UJG2_9STRA|nr:unnamed protein product [Peronospora farinosa]CAI5736587.1 unnamed protein product [Peronospora farinosa]
MRWYCVHPNLPLQAELRIRVAPDSSAPVRGRISHGRAVTTGSLVVHASGNDDDTTTDSWLQVAYLDAVSGEMKEGFMMAALPNGMSLVTPWETTDYRGCCEVMDPVTLMFDGPQDAAQSLGAVQSVEFLYCIMEESKTRIRIFHPKLESVWINKESLEVVCTRLEHEECSTPHAFYEMNDKLPEEAQIAVRENPSKEAHVVGLLSRDETLEVTMRSGNWLQIVGGSLDKAWIMFRTDAMELLQKARDVCSSNCRMIQRDVKDMVDVGNADNQAFCADIHTANSYLVKKQGSTTIVSQVDHERDATLEVVDIGEMGNEHATVTEDDFSGMTVNVDTAEHSQAWEDRPFCPAQPVAVDDDSATDTTASRTDVTNDVGNTSALGSALDTNAKFVEPARAVQASDDHPTHSESFTHGEADAGADAVDDAVDDVAAAKNVGVHLNDTNMENEQIGYTRRIKPARAISNEVGNNDSSIAINSSDMASSKKNNMKKTENVELDQTVASQGDHPTRLLFKAPDAVGKPVTNAVHSKATMINTDANDSSAVGPDLSWDDRPIRPARKGPAASSCSVGTGTFAISEERDTFTNPGSLSWDGSLRITAKSDDEIGNIIDATAFSSADIVRYNIAKETAELVQNVKSWDNLSIRPVHLNCDGVPVGNEDMTTGNGAINYAAVASCDDTCATGKKFELWGGRSINPARAQFEKVDTNISSTAHVDKSSPAIRFNAKDSAVEDLGPVHNKQPGKPDRPVQPAQTVFDRTVGNVDIVDSSETCVNLHVANCKKEAARPSPRSDTPADCSLPTIPNEADDESVNSGCDNLCFRHTYVGYDKIDCNDDTDSLAGEKETKSNVVEPSPGDQRSIWLEQTMCDAPPDGDVKRKRIGAAIIDANIANVPSANEIKKELEEGNHRRNSAALKDCFTTGGAGSAAVTENVLAAAISEGDNTLAEKIDFINVRPTVMDEVEEVTRVQTATSQDYPSALDGKVIVFSGAGIETVQDRDNLQSTTRLNVFERRYAESETTSGSENDEIALLGGLEDVFDPVDEWLSAMQEEDNEGFRNGYSGTLPGAIRKTETSRSRGNAINGEQGEQSDSSKESNSACHSAEEKTQTKVAVQPAGISLLQAFGIRKYCKHKQNLIISADELSLAMYEASQDNSDLIFQALVGDDPLSDDWFYDVSLHNFQADKHLSSKDVDLQSAAPRLTFDLIMSGASPEDILAAEQSDDDCGDFDLVNFFKYPVPRRKVIGPSRPPAPFGRVTSAPAGIDTKIAGATLRSKVEAIGIRSRAEALGASYASRQSCLPSYRMSTETSQEPDITAVTYSKTALSKQCISQRKIPTPRSRLRRNSVMNPVAISKSPSSLVRLRSVMQPLHGASPGSSADPASSDLAPPLEALTASICATSTSSLAPPSQFFFQRQGFVSTPSSSKALSARGLAKNSITSSKPTEVSGLSAPRKSFGFRHPLGLTRKT